MTTLLLPSTSTPGATSPPGILAFLDHTCAAFTPKILATKESSPPALVRLAPPKPIDPWNLPARATSPAESTASPWRTSSPDPPNLRVQLTCPAEVYFTTKTSRRPELESGPPPKSTVPSKVPPTYTLPEASAPIAMPASLPVEPIRFDQAWAPVGEYFTTKTSFPPALRRAPPPKSAPPPMAAAPM